MCCGCITDNRTMMEKIAGDQLSVSFLPRTLVGRVTCALSRIHWNEFRHQVTRCNDKTRGKKKPTCHYITRKNAEFSLIAVAIFVRDGNRMECNTVDWNEWMHESLQSFACSERITLPPLTMDLHRKAGRRLWIVLCKYEPKHSGRNGRASVMRVRRECGPRWRW